MIVLTVHIATLAVVFKMFPTFNSVVNKVPVPVTAVDVLNVVIVPVRTVLGQAVALKFPVPTEVIVAAEAEKLKPKNK